MTAAVLLGWLAALLLARHGQRTLAALVLLAVVLSVPSPAAPPDPAAAFLCVWLLLALALLRRRLDGAALRASLYQGLVALAALLPGVDGGARLAALLPAEPLLSVVALLLPFSLLYFAGLVLCLLTFDEAYPWDYPLWAAGWLLCLYPPLPLLAGGQGLGALLLTAPPLLLLYAVWRRQAPLWGWGLSALLLPLTAGLLLGRLGSVF